MKLECCGPVGVPPGHLIIQMNNGTMAPAEPPQNHTSYIFNKIQINIDRSEKYRVHYIIYDNR